MLSMSVIATNDAPKKSVFMDGGGNGMYSKEQTAGQDCKPYGMGTQIAGNSIFTRFSNNLHAEPAKDKKSNLIHISDVRKQAAASGETSNENPELDTKECQVVLPKLTKSLDVHINKIKTINLNRLKLLVAKNVVKRDFVSLDMTRVKTDTDNCNKRDRKETRDPLPTVNAEPVANKSDGNANRNVCRDVLSQILDLVATEPDGQKPQPVTAFNESLESEQNSIHSLVDKIVTELSGDKDNSENVDIRSVSSDYGSLKLSDNENEHEEVSEICEDVEVKHKLVLDWLDADRLPTPSPPNSPKPTDGNCDDKQQAEVAAVPELITTSDISTKQRISPLKLCLKNIKAASCAKTLDTITKKLNRLILSDEEPNQQTANCDDHIEVQTPTPSIVIYATVDNNCIIETVDFSGENKSARSPKEDRSNSSNVQPNEGVPEAKDAKEKCKKTKLLSLEVLESKVDEVSRNLQFDLEDTMSFKQSAIDLLSNKKVSGAKRKKSGQPTCRKTKKKQLQIGNAEKTIKSVKDNWLFALDDGIESPANNSTESNEDNSKKQSDEEFCPSDDTEHSNYEPSSRQTRSKCGPSPDNLCVDNTLTYKKMLRKRQSVNFLDIDSDDFEAPSPTEPKKQKNNKKDKTEVDENELAAKTDIMVSSIKSICQLGAIKAPPKYSALVIDLPNDTRAATCAAKQTLNQEVMKPLVEVNGINSVVNDSELFDTPLDLSKKVLDEQTRNPCSQQTSNNEQLPPKTAVPESISKPEIKQPEPTEIKSITVENSQKIVHEKQRLEEEIKQTINKCKEESLLAKAKQQELAGALSPLQFSSLNAFPFGIYNAELFQHEYQRLQKELTTLDFVAQQKERERNNILQLKKQRIAAMQQLQLRKQLLAQVQAKVQPLNNSPLTTTATTTTAATAIQIRQPLPISTCVSTLLNNKNCQAQDCSPAARLSTCTEVTQSVRPNTLVIRPIVTKAIPTNKPVMPLRPKFNPPYPHGAMPNQSWLRNQLQVTNAGYNQYSLNSVQTIISKASENIGTKWANDNPRAPNVPIINQRILKSAITAQRRDLPPANSQSNIQITQQMKKQNESGSVDRIATPNAQYAEDCQNTKLTCLLTINQNYNKVNTPRKITPRWPSCQNCQNQIARFICAGCNKQWYCSEKCQCNL